MGRGLKITDQISDNNTNKNGFLANTKKSEKGVGDMLPHSRIKGFVEDKETNYVDTSEFSEYLFPDKQDAYKFPFQSDYHKSRAINQSNWEQAGHVAAKVLPNTILEFTGMLGNTLDIEDYANTDDEIGNWLNTWAQEKKAEINEALPIYRENPDTPLDVGDFAWWMENGSALIESAAAFVGLGYVTGGASLRALSNAGKALEFLNVLNKGARATDAVKKGTHLFAGLGNTLMLNQAEGVGVAINVYDEVYNDTLNTLRAENKDNLPIEELETQAKQEAAKKASSALNFNRINTLLNLTSAFSFIKAPKLTRQLINKPTISRSIKRSGLEGLQESGEELVNLISEKQALDDNYTLEKGFKDALSAEGVEAALLGFVGGAGQTALTNAGRLLPLNKDSQGNRVSRNSQQLQDFYEQQETLNRWEGLSKSEKFSEISDVYMKSQQSLELYKELQTAIQNEETDKVTEIKNTLLRNQAYDAFSTGTTEQLINVFKGISSLDESEAELKGLDVDTYVEDSNKAINTIKSLEKEYNKSKNYIDSYSVYENRANNVFLSDIRSSINTSLENERMELFADLQDLGINEDVITTTEEGRIKFKNFNRYGKKKKDAINNLESYNNYKELLNKQKEVNKDIEENTLEYSNLISDTYQKEVQSKITEAIAENERIQREAKTKEQQKSRESIKLKKKQKFKKDTQSTTPITNEETTEETEVQETVDSAQPFKFSLQGDDFIDNVLTTLEQKENELYNSNKSTEDKVKHYKQQLNNIQNIPDLDENLKAGITAQYNKTIKELSDIQSIEASEEENRNVALNNAKDSIRNLADNIENLSPLQEKSNFRDAANITEKINLVNNVLDRLHTAGVNIKSFPAVATFANDVLGKDRFSKLFNDFKDLYNLSRVSPTRATESYEDIFLTNEEKVEIVSNESDNLANTYLFDLYNLSDLEYGEEIDKTVSTFLENQGYSLYNKDSVTFEGFKIRDGYSSLAHLDKLYKTDIDVKTTDTFNVLDFYISKKDLNRKINSRANNAILDFNKINVGSKISLKVLDRVIYDDGTIVYKDGRVEKDGEITKENPLEVAPIGIVYDNKVIEGAYLHIPSWIPNNIADSADETNQQEKLRKIRRAVLEANNQTIDTIIEERTDGHLMFDPEGTLDTVKNNMPKADLAIGKDDMLYTGKESTVEVNRDRLPIINNGWVYTVFPVNKDSKMAIPIQPIELKDKPEIVNSILEAVRLYINNNPNDTRVNELFDKTGINIITIEGLRDYLNKFLYLNPNLDFRFSDFKTFVTNADEKQSIIRISGNNIEFGRGANVGDTIKFINRDILKSKDISLRNRLVDSLLQDFKQVLENNTRLNVKKEFFNKDFLVPVITDSKVEISKLKYNDFVKENSKTAQYSIELDNGNIIYTVQSNIHFNTDFALKPKKVIIEESQETEETVSNDITSIDFGNDTLEIDFNTDLGDLSPKTLDKGDEKLYKETTPKSLSIQGISLPVQTTIINYLVYNIVKDVVKSKKGNLALDYIGEFQNKIKGAINLYKQKLETVEDVNTKQGLQNSIDTLTSIDANYKKLEFIVLDKLRTFNNLKINKTNFTLLRDTIEELDNDELFDSELLEDTSMWSDGGVFEKDVKNKISTRLKNYLSSILDVSGFTYENGERIAIDKKSPFLGLLIPVPFDYVINELNGILAYNNFNNTLVEPTFESMIKAIDEWVEYKPFLHNVIKELRRADESLKNEFVTVMSKHYTNHIYAYRNKKGRLSFNNSDNKSIIKTIQQEWYNNIINSPLVLVDEDRNYTIDKDTLEDIKSDVANLLEVVKTKDTSKIVNTAYPVLKKLGFHFNKQTIKEIQENGITYNKSPYSLIHLFKNSDGIFKILLDRLTDIQGLNIEEHHPFANNSALDKFTRVFARQFPSYFVNSFRDVRGRMYYSYSVNKFLVDRFKDLKHNKSLLDKLSKQPFSKTSKWLKELNHNPNFKDIFQYFTIDGLSIAGQKGKKLDRLSPAEYEEFKVNLFFSQNKKGSDYIINLFYPTTSDKTVQYGIRSLGKKWSKMIRPNNTPSDAMIDELYKDIVQPEINRILTIQKNPDSHNIKGYKEGGLQFVLIPTLNAIEDLWVKDTHSLVEDIETNERLKILIKKELYKYVITEVQNKINKWKNFGFTKEIEDQLVEDSPKGTVVRDVKRTLLKYDTGNNNIVHDAYDYVINYLVGNTNVYQLFTTDPAFYWKSGHWKTVASRNKDLNIKNRAEALQYYTAEDWVQEHEDLFDNLGKRLGADSAPGNDIVDSTNNTFKLGVIADQEKESYLKDYYKGLLRMDYPKVNATDAQEFTTLREHLYLMNKQGIIDSSTMNTYLSIDRNDGKFSDEDLSVILQPMKPVYVSNVWNNNIEHRVYVKSSSFPLFKQLTKGLEIDKLRKAMKFGKFDRVAFESAVKIGGVVNPFNIYKDNEGNLKDKLEITAVNNGDPISRKGFKIQQNVPYKEKQVINDGTQQRKLLTANIRDVKNFKILGEGNYTGQEIQDHIDDTYNKIFKIKYDELINEIGYNVMDNTISNFSKLQEILEIEGLARNYSLYDLEALKEDNGDFAIPLWLTGVSSKIESLLNSIVDNRVRKLTPKGQSFVLGTSEGFKPILEGDIATDYIRNTSNIVMDKEWLADSNGILRPMRLENGVVKPAEVMLPFKMYDDEGNKLDIKKYVKNGFINTELLPDNILKLFGFRIPTQNLNSMSMIKIVGFLPEFSGDLLLAPAEWTVKMGSDFDIDKLYSLLYNITVDKLTGKVSKYEGDNELLKLENHLLDLHFSVLENPSKKVQSEIARPLSFGKLIDKDKDTDLVREIYPLIEDRAKGKGLTEDYQTFKYNNARAGKAGIGVFSTDSVFNALIQNKDIYLQERRGKDIFPTSFKFAGKNSNKLSYPKTNTGVLKSNVIEAFQSLSVDNENEQGLHKLNINKFTFDAIRGLVFSGYDETYISYLLNQPIIRKYIELKEIQEDSITVYSIEDLEKDINELFPITDEEFINNQNYYGSIKLDTLKESIGITDTTILDTNLQRFLLNIFEKTTTYGRVIKGIQSALNVDSSGLGKDLFYSSEKENQILRLPESTSVANVSNLIGDYITLQHSMGQPYKVDDVIKANTELQSNAREWFNGSLSNKRKEEIINSFIDNGYVPITNIKQGKILNTIKFIKPTTISGFAATYALMLNNTLWERYFPYNSTKLQGILESLRGVMNRENTSITDLAELNRTLFNTVKSYLISSASTTYTDGNIESTRNRLLMDTDNNQSLATIIKSLKDSGTLSNAFINRLEFDINKEILPSNIIYKANVAENIDERGIYAAFSQMFTDKKPVGTFNGIDYTVQKLAQELVTHQLLTGGIQKANQFIKYIPINYLEIIGYYDYMKSIDFNDEAIINYNNIKNQLLQHKPKEVLLHDGLKELINGKNYKYYDNNTIIRQLDTASIDLPYIFSIEDSLASKGYKIYFYNTETRQWEQKDTLGRGDILEYTFDKPFGTTSIPSNKVPEVKVRELPKDIKELEVNLKLSNQRKEGQIIYEPKEQSIVDTYQLNKIDTSVNKYSFILDKIIENNFNDFNTVFAKSLLENINTIQDIEFIVDTNLEAKGSFNIKDKTIKINPLELDSKKDFEETILEEIIHAFTKQAIINNSTGEVLRLKALRQEAEDAVREYLGKGADIKIATTINKVKKGIALNDTEANIIYPILNAEEFIGRLFKSKKLQEILNNKSSKVEGKSILDKFLDFIVDVLNKVGITINENSVLDYALRDIISLIKQPAPSNSITGELQKSKRIIRTKEHINKKYKLIDDNGNLIQYDNAQEIADTINNVVSNLYAKVENGFVILENTENLSPKKKSAKSSPLLKSINNRIYTLKNNIDKADKKEEFDRVARLKEQLEDLEKKKGEVVVTNRLRDLAVVGNQDMQEIAEMFSNPISLEDTLYIRKVLHFWKSAIDSLFDEDEKSSQVLLDIYKDIEAQVYKFEHKLEVIENDYMENLLKKYGTDLTVEEIFYHFKDINNLHAHTLDISRSNNELLDSVFLAVKEAGIDAKNEMHELLSDLDNMENKIRPILSKYSKDGELYDIFRQRTNNNNLTGHLVNRYSYNFFKDRRNHIARLEKVNNFKSYKRFINWANTNLEHVRLDYLFPFKELNKEEKAKAEEYKEQLKEKLGETHYNEYIKEQGKLIDNFNNYRNGYLNYLSNFYNLSSTKEVLDNKEAYNRYLNWLVANSPYQLSNQINKGEAKAIGKTSNYTSHNFLRLLPTKDEYYDSNFKNIENNKDLLDFYNYFVSIDKELKRNLSTDDRIRLSMEGIPYINKVLLEQYKDKGMKVGLLPIWDGLKESIRSNEEGIIDYSVKDPITETEEERLKVRLTSNNKDFIDEYINNKIINYEIENKKPPKTELLTIWREEAVHIVSQKKSYNLPKVLRMYALTSLSYKHKSRIEDSIKLAQNILHQQQEYARTRKGIIKTDEAGRPETKNKAESFKNTKNQFDYFVKTFYGKAREDEGETSKKIYTSAEKERLKELKDTLLKLDIAYKAGNITDEKYEERKKYLDSQINKMGGVAIWSRRGDALLKYVQIKGMGWNLMSSIANIGFGFISNYIEASGGQLYTNNQLTKAYSMVLGSVGKNATFNKYDVGQSKKIRSLMDKWDVLKDASTELFQSPLTVETSKNTKWLAPYNLIQRTEYLNQAPIMIALALNTKVNEEGVTLWEALDENGNWKSEYGEEPTELIKKYRIKLDQINKMNHGNYDPDSPLLIKQRFVGRALSQFRSWMYEGYAVRFEEGKFDSALGIERKGRYRSLANLYNNRGLLLSLSDLSKGFIKRLTFNTAFKSLDFDNYVNDDFSETDAANIRKVITELILLAGIYSTYLLLQTITSGLDDEEDKVRAYTLNNLMNQGLRLKTDLIFYISPGEFKNLLRDLIPATTVIKDTLGWIDSVEELVKGNDTISSGVYSGHSRFLRETAQMLPFGTQVYKNINYSIQNFDK